MSTRDKRGGPPEGDGRRRPLAADPVFESLAGAILRGKFGPGSPLPPERELAALFNVSRLIVRQALHRLRDIGLVRGGQGGQTMVLDPEGWNDPRIVALTMQLAPERADEQDVLERQLLAGAMLLELAEIRIEDPEIDALAAIVAKAAAAPQDLAEFESEYWMTIARTTKNRILLREARWWFDMLKVQPERRARIYGKPQLRIALYHALVEQLRKREGTVALYLKAMRVLLTASPRP